MVPFFTNKARSVEREMEVTREETIMTNRHVASAAAAAADAARSSAAVVDSHSRIPSGMPSSEEMLARMR